MPKKWTVQDNFAGDFKKGIVMGTDLVKFNLNFNLDFSTAEGVLALAQEWCLEQDMVHDDIISLRLVLDELLTNILNHSKPKGTNVKVDLEIVHIVEENKSNLKIAIRDNGVLFNPLTYKVKDIDNILGTEIGGRGLALIQLLTKNATYSSDNGNYLTLILPLAQALEENQNKVVFQESPISNLSKFKNLLLNNLAFRQTVLFTLITIGLLWGGIGFFYILTQNIIKGKIQEFGEQTLHSQSIISSTYLDRVKSNLDQLIEILNLSELNDIFANDNAKLDKFLNEDGNSRVIMADSSVYGIIAGKDGKTWLYTFTDGKAKKSLMQEDLSKYISSAFDASASSDMSNQNDMTLDYNWKSLLMTFSDNDPHASMIYGKYLSKTEKDGWFGIIVTMPWIAETLHKLSGFTNAKPLYFDQNGQYIIFPPNRKLGSGPQSLGEEARLFNIPKLLEIEKNIISGKKGLIQLDEDFAKLLTAWNLPWSDLTSLIYYPMYTKGWFLALLVQSRELGNYSSAIPIWLVLAAIICPLFVGMVTWLVTSHTLKPLASLTKSIKKMGSGDLDTPFIKAPYPDEIGMMIDNFDKIRITLRSSFRNLVDSAIAQQGLINEFAIAQSIQDSILPQNFPKNSRFQISATIKTAREVYGDLYDCFEHIDNKDKWCVVIGDVCGKGIPAALIMSSVISLARSFLLDGFSPAKTLEKVNTALLRRDTSSLFVTMLTAIIDFKTGIITFASAGHPPPIINNSLSNEAVMLDWTNELVLGVKNDLAYSCFSHQLNRGDSVLFYTDGANEAISPPSPHYGEVYGEENLIKSFSLACQKYNDSNDILNEILKNLFDYMQSTVPADDISLIVVNSL